MLILLAPELAEPLVVQPQHVLAVDQDLARRRVVEPVDHPDQCGLARARQPHDHEDLALARRRTRRRAPRPRSRSSRGARPRAGRVRRADDALGVRPVDLPDVAARDRDARLLGQAPPSRVSEPAQSVGFSAPAAQGRGCDMGNGRRARDRRFVQTSAHGWDVVRLRRSSGGGSAGSALANRLSRRSVQPRAGPGGGAPRLHLGRRSSTCRRHWRSPSAAGSTTGSTNPSPSRT